jgi:Ca2+-binding EF-hand superfamily protein
MAFYGVGIDCEVARLINEIKMKLANKYGCYGLRQLDLAYKELNSNTRGLVTPDQFIQTLNSIGVFVRQIDNQALVKYFGRNGQGINTQEFVDRFREKLSPERETIVKSAFNKLDTNQGGSLCPNEISILSIYPGTLYRSNFNSDFVLGRKSEQDAVKDYFGLFDKNQDGKITYDEWKNYYVDVSSMTGGDFAFRELVNNSWGEVTKNSSLSQEEVNGYINLIRERLVTMTKGVEDEFKLQKLYKSFDKHNSGMLSLYEFDGMLLQLNIVVPKDVMPSLFKALDKNKSGYIEFDEFCNFILYNPYKR